MAILCSPLIDKPLKYDFLLPWLQLQTVNPNFRSYLFIIKHPNGSWFLYIKDNQSCWKPKFVFVCSEQDGKVKESYSFFFLFLIQGKLGNVSSLFCIYCPAKSAGFWRKIVDYLQYSAANHPFSIKISPIKQTYIHKKVIFSLYIYIYFASCATFLLLIK